GPATTAGQLTEALAGLGAGLMLDALDEVAAGTLVPRPQPEDGVTYAAKLKREEAQLDWRLPAAHLERQVRAFDPWPGALFFARDERIRVLAAEAEPLTVTAPAGTVRDERLSIACGDGALRP